VGIAVLFFFGLLQMGGDLAGRQRLRDVAAATAASPAPKVFSTVRGLETFSTRQFLEWKDSGGEIRSLELTPASYARIRGPYTRRTVFAATLSRGPLLVSDPRGRRMFAWAARYAMCEPPAALLWELGVGEGARQVQTRMVPRERSLHDPSLPLVLTAPCRKS